MPGKKSITAKSNRFFYSVSYHAEFWTQPPRTVAKVEYTHLVSNQRFVVTNLVRDPRFVYDDFCVLRGDVERNPSRN